MRTRSDHGKASGTSVLIVTKCQAVSKENIPHNSTRKQNTLTIWKLLFVSLSYPTDNVQINISPEMPAKHTGPAKGPVPSTG